MSALRFRLLNGYQRGFPLQPEPFAAIARDLDTTPDFVTAALSRLQAQGAVSRVGAVFRPGALGAGTLAAMAVPPARLDAVAHQVGRHAEVNHNYEREHAYNLWFVATAADRERLAALLARIESETNLEVIALPLLEEYHIDLGFDLTGGDVRERCSIGERPAALAASERTLVSALQQGLPLLRRPYRAIGQGCGMSESEVIARLSAWQENGIIRRFGVVVRHLELGYRANAMVVWSVPDERVSELGARLAREPAVSLCYRRARRLPDWPYNLYCMIHGKQRATVLGCIEIVSRALGLNAFPREILFSTRRFKQTGARYVAQTEHARGCA